MEVPILYNENELTKLIIQNQIQEVIKTNDYTDKFGLSLSKEEANQLIISRGEALKEQRRIEFGEGILPKLIFEFCDSPFIYQDNYVETLQRLQEIFYLYKNESLDEVSDDELIHFMKQEYEGKCEGSLDNLEDTSLEEFARQVRAGTRKFIGLYGDDNE